MNSEKSALRQTLKRARLEMTEADHTRGSRAIVERLKVATDWAEIGNLHFFEPIHELMEVDILDFITHLQDNYPDIKLATSRKFGDTWEFVSLGSDLPPQQFDAVIVPMLGFDTGLQRIGFGGGYYDKFLATQTKVQKIGVCFEQGRVNTIPAEPHDIALSSIVTENGVYEL
jgi:5-formyltetrahydrofolate cyclo-ligase